jgi:hypothetical protein
MRSKGYNVFLYKKLFSKTHAPMFGIEVLEKFSDFPITYPHKPLTNTPLKQD